MKYDITKLSVSLTVTSLIDNDTYFPVQEKNKVKKDCLLRTKSKSIESFSS